MNNKPEHTADISAELRDLSRSAGYCELQPTVFGKPIARYFAELADRIDAAKMRECAEQREGAGLSSYDCQVERNAIAELGEKPCNMAAMRDALVAVKKLFDDRLMFQQAIRACHEKVNRALAEPPRNCDMFGGDAKMLHMVACARKQERRHGMKCENCEAFKTNFTNEA